MKSLSKFSAALTATLALNACAPNQPAEAPQVVTGVRSDFAEALAQIGTDREGIQAGPNQEMLYSVVCGTGLLEDRTRDDVNIAAMRQLVEYACPNDSKAYVPVFPAGGGKSGQMICERVMTTRTVVCERQKKELQDPQ